MSTPPRRRLASAAPLPPDATPTATPSTERAGAAGYRRLLAALDDGVVVVDGDGTVTYANPRAEDLLALESPTMVGLPLGIPLPDRRGTVELEVPDGRGSYRLVQVRATSVPWAEDQATMLTIRDVTEPAGELDELRRDRDRYALAMQGSDGGLWDWDIAEGTLHVNARWRELVGILDWPEDDHAPGLWLDRTHDADKTALLDALDAHLTGKTERLTVEHRIRHQGGHHVWMLAQGRAVFDERGEPIRVAGSLTDISRRRELEDRLRHDARHDPLTGLANRRLLLERLDAVTARSARTGAKHALVLLDLDGFKQVNDVHGHEAGDEVLVEVAERLRTDLRPGDLPARLGGDEFAVVLEDLGPVGSEAIVAARLDALLKQPHDVEGVHHVVPASIGVAIPADGGTSVPELLRIADDAMYQAKDAGSPVILG